MALDIGLFLPYSYYIDNATESSMTKTTAAQDIAEMMAAWNKIMTAAREQFPGASEERLYEIAKGAMVHALGL